MGNNKSTFQIEEENEDPSFGFNKRGHSVRYLRLKRLDGLDVTGAAPTAGEDALKRSNSLPMRISTPKTRKNILGQPKLAKGDGGGGGGGGNRPIVGAPEMSIRPIPVQGFDLIRHHFGQRNVEDTRLSELEANIQMLNEKLTNLEACRQECLRQLIDLRDNPPEMPITPGSRSAIGRKKSLSSAGGTDDEVGMRLPLAIIDNYLRRVANLLAIDQEPLLLNHLEVERKKNCLNEALVLRKECEFRDPKGKSKSAMSLVMSNRNITSNGHVKPLKIKIPSHNNIRNKANSQQNATPIDKCRQIKEAYSQLIRSILPQLYGRYFGHRNDADFRDYRARLEALEDGVRSIPIAEEQCLLDAQRLFLDEIDGYLCILEDMVLCRQEGCSICKQVI